MRAPIVGSYLWRGRSAVCIVELGGRGGRRVNGLLVGPLASDQS